MSTQHARQSFLGPDSSLRFGKSKIAIIGLCGGGSHVAQQMAHVGFGNFILADFDHVEDPNLNRMVGACPMDAELARPKNVVIEEMIHRINPQCNVQHAGHWQEHGTALRTCDIIVGCVDTFSARNELEKFSRRFLIPYIDIGMDVHRVSSGHSISGQVALSLPCGHCLWCLGILTEERLAQEQQRYGAAGGKPQVIWPNGVLASIAVGHAVSILSPWSTDLPLSPLIEYDGNRHITRPGARLLYLQNDSCPHFGDNVSTGDPFFSLHAWKRVSENRS
jgi:hypothetical protein